LPNVTPEIGIVPTLYERPAAPKTASD
jgi:hypothetical protein